MSAPAKLRTQPCELPQAKVRLEHARSFIAVAELELGRALRRGGRSGDQPRAATLLASAEAAATAMGLTRVTRLATQFD